MYGVRPTSRADFDWIIDICRRVYPFAPPWTLDQLSSHLRVFPEGQCVAVRDLDEQVVGAAASLIIFWEDYNPEAGWQDFTDRGYFTNHDPVHGKTLYGAEVFVDPGFQRQGIGKLLYEFRKGLARRLNLRRIRAVARLSGYAKFADTLPADGYVKRVVSGELTDPTLSFQLRHGFRVLGLIRGYLRNDPESQGYGALIEWRNSEYRETA